MIVQTLFLVSGTAAVGCICWGGVRLLALALRRTTPFWNVQLPWTLFHAYLVTALYAGGGLPAPAGAFAGVLALTAGVTAAGGYAAGIRRAGPEARALLFAWALPWGVALLLAVV